MSKSSKIKEIDADKTNELMHNINASLEHLDLPLIKNMTVVGCGIMADRSVQADIVATIYVKSNTNYLDGFEETHYIEYEERGSKGLYNITVYGEPIEEYIPSVYLYKYFTDCNEKKMDEKG